MSWICKRCETENPDTTDICEVCDSPHFEIKSERLNEEDILMWNKKAVSYDNIITKHSYLKSKYENKTYQAIFIYAPNLLISADKGNQDAQYMLGDLFLSHKSVDYKANAFVWLARAANQGNGNAMAKLALCYEEGYGTVKNNEEAKKWYERALNKNCDMPEMAQQGLCRIQKRISSEMYKACDTPRSTSLNPT